MYLVNDENLILSDLRRYLDLLYKFSDVFNGIIGSCVKFMNIIRTIFVKCNTTFTYVASLSVCCGGKTVDVLGEYTSAGCLANSSRSAEKISMGQFPLQNCILQRHGQRMLPYDTVEIRRAVFSRRNNILVHKIYLNNVAVNVIQDIALITYEVAKVNDFSQKKTKK